VYDEADTTKSCEMCVTCQLRVISWYDCQVNVNNARAKTQVKHITVMRLIVNLFPLSI